MSARVLEVKAPGPYVPGTWGAADDGNDSRGSVLLAMPALDYSSLGDELVVKLTVAEAQALRQSLDEVSLS